MKIKISSSHDKRLKYKIYSLYGCKRKLLRKGKFLHNEETEIETEAAQLIVRIQRRSLFIALLKSILIIPLNFINGAASGTFPSQTTSIMPYEEIRIMCLNYSQDVVMQYEKSPMLKDEKPFEKTLKVDYLSCQTYPYETNYNGKKLINIALYAFAVTFWVALITAICLLIRFLILHV